MTKPDLRETILAYLRAAAGPVSSRDLARRFLLIQHGDESTCHRLLAPYLSGCSSLQYIRDEGWLERRPGEQAPAAGTETIGGTAALIAFSGPEQSRLELPLHDFVALAADGTGPSGSGALRVVSLQPVVAGEICELEVLPAWAADEDADFAGRATGRGIGLDRADLSVLVETVGSLPIVCHRVAREATPLLDACASASLSFHPIIISLAKLGHLLLGLKPRHAPCDLAAALGLEMREPDDCRGRVRLMAHCLIAMTPMLEEIGITTFGDLLTFQNQPAASLDFAPYAFSAEDLKALPARPGIYRFLDRDGRVIYVGKAKNLRARISSYFIPSARGTERGRAILERIHSLRFELIASELEALLTEAALIAELRPPLNRQFDVHDRPAPYGPRLNLAVVLPDCPAGESESATTCTVHLMQQGRYRLRIRGLPAPPAGGEDDRERWRQLEEALGMIYFPGPEGALPQAAPGLLAGEGCLPQAAGTSGHPGPDRTRGTGEVDWRLVASYLTRFRDEVNVLDLDECDATEAALARLRILAGAAVDGERVVAR